MDKVEKFKSQASGYKNLDDPPIQHHKSNKDIDIYIHKCLKTKKRAYGKPVFDFFESCDLGYLNSSQRRKFLMKRSGLS